MPQNFEAFRTLVFLSIRNPRQAADVVMDLQLPGRVLWYFAALIAIVSVILAFISSGFAPPPDLPQADYVTPSPLGFSVIVIASISIMLLFGYGVGRAFGGTARFNDIQALVIWLQALLFVANCIQLPVLLVSPFLAEMIGYMAMLAFIWVLSGFIAQAHGFQSVPLVLTGVVGTALVIGVILSVVMTTLGYVPG